MNRPFSGLNRAECVSLMKRYPLSIGILAGQWLKLGEYLQTLRALEQPVLHLDLMDGHFCPQFTVGPWAITQLPAQIIKDVHLMVDNPWPVVQASVKAGAHCVTLQVENSPHLHHMLHWLGEQNAEVSGGTMPVLRGSVCARRHRWNTFCRSLKTLKSYKFWRSIRATGASSASLPYSGASLRLSHYSMRPGSGIPFCWPSTVR